MTRFPKIASGFFFCVLLLPGQPSFEVAAVKPAPPGMREGVVIQPGGRFVAGSISLASLISSSWCLPSFRMSGVDGWVAKDVWNIEAKAAGISDVPKWSAPCLPEPFDGLVRALLEDRFALKTHMEEREIPVYQLIAVRSGTKLTKSDDVQGRSLRMGPGAIVGTAVTMSQVVLVLSRVAGRPVVDQTGLEGTYDFKLEFAPELSPASPATEPSSSASLFTAIQEQMGLKLEPAKKTFEVLVVDSAQKPNEN